MKTFTKALVLVALLAVTSVTARPSGDEPNDDEAPRVARTTSYHGANTRIDPPSDVGLKYYGGARGLVLTYHPVLGLTPGAATKKEEEEDVGQETEPPAQKPPPATPGDSVVISKPPPGASVAEARPVGLAIAGVGGTAASQPTGTAVVGPNGLAISRPVATAIAGVQLGENVLSSITGSKPQTSDVSEGFSASMPAPQSYTTGSNESPVVVAVAPGALQNLYYHVNPSKPEDQAKTLNLRGVQYGHNRPSADVMNQRPSSPYQEPSGNRGPMYGYKPSHYQPQRLNLQRFSQSPFFTQGASYAYPDLPIDLKNTQQVFAYNNDGAGQEAGRVSTLAVGPSVDNGKYGIVPLSKMSVEENKQPMSISYQFVTGGKPAVGFNQVAYPVAYY